MIVFKQTQTLGIIFLMLFILSPRPLWAANGMKGPFAAKKKNQTPYYQTSTVKLVAKGAITFFSKWISPADGPRSPSYPTGTAYGRQALEKHGFFMGILLIGDRLFHESDIHLGPRVDLYGKTRYFDPVESNTFWWDQETGSQ